MADMPMTLSPHLPSKQAALSPGNAPNDERGEMAHAPVTLSQHLASEQAVLSPEHAPNVAAVVGRIGRVAAVIAQELAHAALRDRLGYVGGTNVTGDEVKKLDVWGHEIMRAGAPRRAAPARPSSPRRRRSRSRCRRRAAIPASSSAAIRWTARRTSTSTARSAPSSPLRPSRGRVPAGPAALGPGHRPDRGGLRDVRPGHHARVHGRAGARTASRSTRRPASSS